MWRKETYNRSNYINVIKYMRLPINIEELLGGRAVEGDRIEYKTGLKPDAI